MKTALPVTGIPKDWKRVKKAKLIGDQQQFAYQNWRKGNISTELYRIFENAWNPPPDSAQMSQEPVRCFVYLLSGEDENGKRLFMLDTDNDLDFNDEKPVVLDTSQTDGTESQQHTVHVKMQLYINGEVIEKKIPVSLVWSEERLGFLA